MRRLTSKFFRPHQLKTRPLGLDIGTSALAFVELGAKTQPKLCAFTMQNGGQEGDECIDIRQKIIGAWQQLHTDNRQVAMALPAQQTRFQLMEVPRLPGYAMDEQLEHDAAALFGLPPEQICMDYQELAAAEGEFDQEEACLILLYAARLEDVQQRQRLLDGTGLQVVHIAPEPLALLASVAMQAPWMEADYAVRVLMHASDNDCQCHIIQPGADFPEQNREESGNFAACIQRILSLRARAVLFAGPPHRQHQLRMAMQQQAAPPCILHAALSSGHLADGGADVSPQEQAGALTLAYGLALGSAA
jgi:Tfp pilus assembly PilM family ATPase